MEACQTRYAVGTSRPRSGSSHYGDADSVVGSLLAGLMAYPRAQRLAIRRRMRPMTVKVPTISIIVPARNASATIGGTLQSITSLARTGEVEVIVVNDASEKAISDVAAEYPVKIVDGDARGVSLSPKHRGAESKGSLILFTDADCRVSSTWLTAHINAHMRFGEMLMAGGSGRRSGGSGSGPVATITVPGTTCTQGSPAAWVTNHPGANISVTRSTLERVGPFCEDLPEAVSTKTRNGRAGF